MDFSGGARRRALLAAAAILTSAMPPEASAEQTRAGAYVVTFAEVQRFDGAVEPLTIVCPAAGACDGTARIFIQGRLWQYALEASVMGAQLAVRLASPRPTWPPLSFGRDNTMSVPLQRDGTGVRHAALIAVGSEYKYPGYSGDEQVRIPLANIRITVRREGTAEQDR